MSRGNVSNSWKKLQNIPLIVRLALESLFAVFRHSVSRKTHQMGVRIELRDGESIREALYRFRKMVFWARKRKSHKTRPGAYEKPSIKRRRREGLEFLNAMRAEEYGRGSTNNNLGLGGLFSRE